MTKTLLVAAMFVIAVCQPAYAQRAGQVRFIPSSPAEGVQVQVQVDLENLYDMQQIVIEVSQTEILVRLRALHAASPSTGEIRHSSSFTAPTAGVYPYRVVIEEYYLGEIIQTVATGTLVVGGVPMPQSRPVLVPAMSKFALTTAVLLVLACSWLLGFRRSEA